MKSFRSILSVSLLGLATVLAGCAADATSGEASEQAALADSTDTTVASATASAATELAQAPRGGRHGRHGGGNDFLVRAALREDLGLSPAQKTVLEGLVAKKPEAQREGKGRPEHQGFDVARAKTFAAAIRSGNVDGMARPKPTAEQKAQHEARRTAQLAKEAATLDTLHSTLTSAQRTALVAALEGHEGKRPEGAPQGKKREGAPDGQKREGREHGKPGAHGGRGEHGGFGPMLADLNLSAAQKDALKVAMEANRPAKPSDESRKEAFQAMRAERKEKLASFASDSFDAKAFVASKAKPELERPAGKVNPMAALVKVLQPEQREKLAQRIEQGPPQRAQVERSVTN